MPGLPALNTCVENNRAYETNSYMYHCYMYMYTYGTHIYMYMYLYLSHKLDLCIIHDDIAWPYLPQYFSKMIWIST